MTSIQQKQTFPMSENYEYSVSDTDDTENIPYHAREYARPFTYGSLPEGFKTSDLNHVTFEEEHNAVKPARTAIALPPSPNTLRKSTRPSISPSRPVLHKTPSRQEFEEMLLKRREQAMHEQNRAAMKLAQNADIQKDLDELQQKLNKSVVNCGKERVFLSDTALVNTESMKMQTRDMSPKPFLQDSALSKAEQPMRPDTPAFPVVPKLSSDGRCASPYPIVTADTAAQHCMKITANAQDISVSNNSAKKPCVKSTSDPHLVEPHLVEFAKDSSKFWYKPHFTREESLALLGHAAPGTFIIRNSTTYKNAYGLVLRVAKPPPGAIVQDASNAGELVRHFLIEPTTRGVRLKGCANEPVFTSLSALVYQHSIVPLALPCRLIIPDRDLLHTSEDSQLLATQTQLLEQGAACNVLYLFSCEMESLTGDEAIRKAVHKLYAQNPLPQPIEVHFKVSHQGITLTDSTRRLFLRRHYTTPTISHIGIDPENRFYTVTAFDEGLERAVKKSIFAFVARPLTGATDNQCHVFCDLAATQPASAIVSFASKILPLNKHLHNML